MGDISIQNSSNSDDDGSSVQPAGNLIGKSIDLFVLKATYEAGLAELRELVNAGVVAKTAAEWASQNPALQQGILGYDITNKRLKIGDGFNDWNDLKFIEEPGLDEIRFEYGNYESFRTNIELTIN